MASFTWFGGSGSLGVASHWLNQPKPASPVVPGSKDAAAIGGAGTLTGSIDVFTASFTGALTLTGQITTESAAFVDGTLAVSGLSGQLTDNGYLAVGDAGNGSLKITGGGTVATTNSTLHLDIAGGVGSTAGVIVDGAGSSLSTAGGIVVGRVGNGALTLTNSGQVKAGGLAVGYLGGSTGVVSVASQGAISTTGMNVGSLLGATGAVTVDGKGSTLTDSGFIAIGDAGFGTLTISNGASFSSVAGSTQNIAVGNQSGGMGSVTVTGSASTLTDADYLVFGYSGIGSLSVKAGGSVSMTNATTAIILGQLAGSTGTATVDGTGSIVSDAGYLFVGQAGNGALTLTNGGQLKASGGLGVGSQGSGVLSLATGATALMSNSTQEISIGGSAGAAGAVRVDGTGSSLTDDGYLAVGDGGVGSLSVTDDATLTTTGGFSIGAQAGSSGTVLVSSGATATTASIGVGYMGQGALAVTAGGPSDQGSVFSTGFMEIGQTVGASGSVSLSGAGSTLTATSGLIVGGASYGSLTVSGGATLDAATYLLVGYLPGVYGAVSITGATVKVGAPGLPVASSGVAIGYGGVGAMTLGAAGMLVDQDTAYVGQGSSLTLSGGSFTSTALTNQGVVSGFGAISGPVVNNSTILATGGVLSLNGAVTGTGSEAIAAGATLQLAGAILSTSGPVTGAAGSILSGVGSVTSTFTTTGAVTATGLLTFTGTGNTFAGAIGGAGTITFSGGSDTLTGTTVSVGAAVINGAQVTISGTIMLGGALSVTTPNLIVSAGGAALSGGGTVVLSNLATNAIYGASSTATLTNNDTILGAGLLGSGVLNLVNSAKAVIDGDDSAALTINTGSQAISNAGTIESTGAGGVTIASAVINSGLLEAIGGNLTVKGAVTGKGSVKIAGGTASFLAAFSEAVAFGATGTLVLAQSRAYTGAISGFSLTGTTALDLEDIAFVSGVTKASYSGTTKAGVLTITSGTEVAKINLTGNYAASTWTLSSDGHGGTIVVDPRVAKVGGPPLPSTALPSVAAFAQAASGFGRLESGPIAPNPQSVGDPGQALLVITRPSTG
jgi:T5SS/PEP-CTERM-associated repeat protein